jgi:hypothetical protein
MAMLEQMKARGEITGGSAIQPVDDRSQDRVWQDAPGTSIRPEKAGTTWSTAGMFLPAASVMFSRSGWLLQ